jgi:acyl-CoA synthetase (NDP forming)
MKAVGSDIQHKTELGLVMLRVEGPDAAAEAYRSLERRALGTGAGLEGVLVERMVAGNREFMVGMKRDPLFGPVVAFGLGGVLTEALGDVALALAPVDNADAAELPGLIRAKQLLGPFRGYPPVDRAALAKIIQAIGRIALDHPHIAEIDVNPLLVEGDQPVAADALIILSAEAPLARGPRAFRPNLRSVLSPKSVAIVGASEDVVKWGGSALRNILDGGYTGTIYPVNPRGGVFFGLPAYASLDELPEVPDLVLLAVGGHQIGNLLEQCGRLGIPAAVAIAAGFSETGEQGAEAEREIARIATEARVTLIGPNCMGLISNERQLHATGFIVLHPPKGKLSFVSQSGNIGTQIVNFCERRGIGIDKFVSVGNEAQVSAIDVADYLRGDPSTTSIMMYLEGIDDGGHFLEVMRRTTPVKPVVVLRGGLTEQGSKAAASHTGAMAGSAAVFQAAARQAGVVTCTTTQDVVDLGACLAYLPLPKGRRVAVVTNGGGAGVLTADEVARNGLVLAELPAELLAALDEILPPFWSRRNPLDMVASAGGDVGPKVLKLVAESEAVDALVVLSVLGVPNTGDEVRPTCGDGEYAGFSPWEMAFVKQVSELMEATGKPIINVPDIPIRGSLFDCGGRYAPIVLASPQAAARALDKMEWYGAFRRERNPLS